MSNEASWRVCKLDGLLKEVICKFLNGEDSINVSIICCRQT